MDEKLFLSKILPAIEENKSIAFELSDSIADEPELGMEEFNTVEKYFKILEGKGFKVEKNLAGLPTAFKASIHPEAKQRMALLAEFDALRGLGHACGHCASGSASLLAFLALSSIESEFDFGVDLIGTPDEEFNGCKENLAQAGCFDNYDFAAMVHMSHVSTPDVGYMALDGIGIKFYGAPSHAASAPWEGKNAFNAARLFFDAVDMMRQHIIPEARIHGFIKEAGYASNIVPDFAEIEFLTRCPRREDLTPITEWVKDCARAAALATHTKEEIFSIGNPFHELYLSPSGRKLLTDSYDELGIEYESLDHPANGSSDIGNVDYVCPAFHPTMSIGKTCHCHTKEFAEAMKDDDTHEAIRKSASLLTAMAAKLYSDPERMNQIKTEHKIYRKHDCN